jgi:thiamine-monophosphate kinase
VVVTRAADARAEAHDSDRQTLSDVGEDALVATAISVAVARAGAGSDPVPDWLRIGPGDDAAVLDLAGQIAVSTDTLVEGHDFVLEWSGGYDVGVKAAAQNLADVAAMGATPRALLVSLAAPGDLHASWARALSEGLAAEAERAGAAVVGGDVSAAEQVVVTGTAVGVLEGVAAVRRSGARPGDVVALAGTTGRSAAGLAVLHAGLRAAPPPGREDAVDRAVAAHLRPRPPYAAGPLAARSGATAMIDISDGLVRDAARVAAASGVVLDLDPAALAPDPVLAGVAEVIAADAGEWALTGGEDHALLACFGPGVVPPGPFRPVGRVLGVGDGEPGVLVGGVPWRGEEGWRHFR